MTYLTPICLPNSFCLAAQSCADFNSVATKERAPGSTGCSTGVLANSFNLVVTLASSALNSSSAVFRSAVTLVEFVKSFSIVRGVLTVTFAGTFGKFIDNVFSLLVTVSNLPAL